MNETDCATHSAAYLADREMEHEGGLAIHRIFLLIRGKMFDDSREDRTARAPRTPGFWGSESMIPDLPGGPGVLAVSVLRRNVTNGESPSCSFFHAGAEVTLVLENKTLRRGLALQLLESRATRGGFRNLR